MDSGFGIGGFGKSAVEMTTSKLDYWSPVVVENGVKKSFNIEIRPQSISQDGPIEFHFPTDPEKFIDIAGLTLHGRVGLRFRSNTGWEEKAEEMGVINNFFHSLFSSVTAKINDFQIGDIANNSYPYTTYLQTLLGTSSSQAANHILSQQGFIKDAPEDMATPRSIPGPFQKRAEPLYYRKYVDFSIPLHNDLMTVEKYLPPNTKLSFTLRRSSNDFVLWKVGEVGEKSGEDYKIIIEDLHMKVKMLEVHPDVLKNHFKLAKENGIRIKFTQNILKTFAVPIGSVEMKQHNLFFGSRLPDRVYLAFVEQDAYNGNIYSNPFNFVSANMQEASLIVNGISEPSPPYYYEEGENEKELYFNFLENTGTSAFEMESVNVSFEEFKKGYFILPFDRSPTKDNGLYTHKGDSGNMTIKVKCRRSLDKNYMVLVFASYDSALMFVEDRVLTERIV